MGIAEVLQNVDAHSVNQEAFGLPSRLIAKIYLFRQIFRGSPYAYANDPAFMHVSASTKFWEGVEERFFGKYKEILNTHNRWSEYVIRGEPIPGPFGRDWSINMKTNWRGELEIPWTQLSNYPVQGTGADVMMLARLGINKKVKEAFGDEVLFISTVHDDIKMDAPNRYVQDVVDICHAVFATLLPTIRQCFGYDWIVPMGCEVLAGMNMKDMEEVKPSNDNKYLLTA